MGNTEMRIALLKEDVRRDSVSYFRSFVNPSGIYSYWRVSIAQGDQKETHEDSYALVILESVPYPMLKYYINAVSN